MMDQISQIQKDSYHFIFFHMWAVDFKHVMEIQA